eukprot:3899801-Prymnesium_polylepis.1
MNAATPPAVLPSTSFLANGIVWSFGGLKCSSSIGYSAMRGIPYASCRKIPAEIPAYRPRKRPCSAISLLAQSTAPRYCPAESTCKFTRTTSSGCTHSVAPMPAVAATPMRCA